MARVLFTIGIAFVLLAGVAWVLERVGLRPGHLPGDIAMGSGNVRFYFPIVTCILLSVILTAMAWVVRSFIR